MQHIFLQSLFYTKYTLKKAFLPNLKRFFLSIRGKILFWFVKTEGSYRTISEKTEINVSHQRFCTEPFHQTEIKVTHTWFRKELLQKIEKKVP